MFVQPHDHKSSSDDVQSGDVGEEPTEGVHQATTTMIMAAYATEAVRTNMMSSRLMLPS